MQEWLPTKLRLLRAQRGLTLVEAADKAGVGRDTLSDLERGRRHPVMPTLAKIAQGYGVPVEELIEEPASPKAPAPSSPEPADEERRTGALVEIARNAAREQARPDAQAIARAEQSGQPQGSVVAAENEAFQRLRNEPSHALAEALVDIARQYVHLEQNVATLEARLEAIAPEESTALVRETIESFFSAVRETSSSSSTAPRNR